MMILGMLAVAAFGDPATGLIDERVDVTRVDGSMIELQVTRPPGDALLPAVMYIDGSLCLPSMLGNEWALPDPAAGRNYALVVVEKPGVEMPEMEGEELRIGPDFACSDEFLSYYDIQQRVIDHLRALQHLRAHAEWWNGELYVWGFSDGGAIGAELTSYASETKRAVLGGFGGGRSFAEEFENDTICAPENTEDRATCLQELRVQFDAMTANPTRDETWLGSANTWKVWATRLNAVQSHVLADATFPFLIFHGTDDRSAPVASARALVDQLRDMDGPEFIYWEVEGMGHSINTLPEAEARELRRVLVSWLLTGVAETSGGGVAIDSALLEE